MILVSGRVPILPERRAEAVEAVHAVVSATQNEAGCIAYDFYADLADPNVFHVFEEWETMDALNAHLKQPHTVAFLQALPQYIAGPPVVKSYEVASAQSLL
jgi:quinol monooxygenase YgiN